MLPPSAYPVVMWRGAYPATRRPDGRQGIPQGQRRVLDRITPRHRTRSRMPTLPCTLHYSWNRSRSGSAKLGPGPVDRVVWARHRWQSTCRVSKADPPWSCCPMASVAPKTALRTRGLWWPESRTCDVDDPVGTAAW